MTAKLETKEHIFESVITADPNAIAAIALEAGRMGGWRWDIVRDEVVGNALFASLFGLEYAAQPWPSADIFAGIHPDDLADTEAAVNFALDGADIYETEFRDNGAASGNKTRWLGARGRVTERGPRGEPLKLIGVNWDISDVKAHEERLFLLAGEMDHRVKNAFAVIRALINLGGRSGLDKANFAETLRAQVEAMATAHTVSARMARATRLPDAPVPLTHVLDTALAPWRDTHEIAEDLPPDEMLSPREVSAVSMLVYELATNAAKYGVLSARGGVLSLSGHVDANGQRTLVWSETFEGPPDLVPAENTTDAGFGMTLIQHCARTLGAEVDRNLTETGLTVTLVMPPKQD